MNESKRFKIAKREKQSFIDLNNQKDLTILQAFEHEKKKNHALNQKNQKLQIKCKIFYDKLYQSNQKPDEIINDLNEEILELDKRIKQLQQQLYFRYSKQMFKLKKKIKNFFHLINFEIDDGDLELISDEIDMILLLMQVFQVKYDQLTSENVQTFELIQKLREPQPISGTAQRIKQLEDELGYYNKQNNNLKNLVKDYERQLIYCKNILDEQKQIQSSKQNGESIETHRAIQKHKARINELDSEKTFKDFQIQKRNKRISDLQNQLEMTNKKAKAIYDEFERCKREDSKWKDRYAQMEQQKNQRIKLLQLQLNRKMGVQNPDDSSIGLSFKKL